MRRQPGQSPFASQRAASTRLALDSPRLVCRCDHFDASATLGGRVVCAWYCLTPGAPDNRQVGGKDRREDEDLIVRRFKAASRPTPISLFREQSAYWPWSGHESHNGCLLRRDRSPSLTGRLRGDRLLSVWSDPHGVYDWVGGVDLVNAPSSPATATRGLCLFRHPALRGRRPACHAGPTADVRPALACSCARPVAPGRTGNPVSASRERVRFNVDDRLLHSA